jgi:sugar/nucleoside kinase (ribokinase family)
MVQYARQGLNELIDDGVDYCSVMNKKMYTETHTLDEALKLKLKNHTIVITQGAKGASVYSANTHFHLGGRRVTAVDANGAGDAFAGAFLYALNQHVS